MTFKEWLEEIEVYSTREHRLSTEFDKLEEKQYKSLLVWLKAAYDAGLEHGSK